MRWAYQLNEHTRSHTHRPEKPRNKLLFCAGKSPVISHPVARWTLRVLLRNIYYRIIRGTGGRLLVVRVYVRSCALADRAGDVIGSTKTTATPAAAKTSPLKSARYPRIVLFEIESSNLIRFSRFPTPPGSHLQPVPLRVRSNAKPDDKSGWRGTGPTLRLRVGICASLIS